MKFIIVGLGNFGASLATKLTKQGNEVIGVDSRMNKVNALKDDITHAVCLDATDKVGLSNLPLKNTDIVVVAIGEDEGANIMVTAQFKNLGVKRLISRAISPIHENVLEALGVHEIVHPEEETAERWAKKLCLKGVLDSFEINSEYSIIEVDIPRQLIGERFESTRLPHKYDVAVLTIMKSTEQNTFLGKHKIINEVKGLPKPDRIFEPDDILVLYGSNKNLQVFLKKLN